jgi:hypothetical protein
VRNYTEDAMAPIYEIRRNDIGDKWRRVLTHLEIRRVQNGFVVMGFNMAMAQPQYLDCNGPKRVCFVCETVESLLATISSLATDTGDFAWEGSVDLPITDLFSEKKAP